MPDSKFGHAAEVIKTKIYIFSGVGHDDAAFPTVEVYDTGEFPQSIDPIGKNLKTWASLKNIE